jgi:hypothetical protein
MGDGYNYNYLDPDRPGAVRLRIDDAQALGEAALARKRSARAATR